MASRPWTGTRTVIMTIINHIFDLTTAIPEINIVYTVFQLGAEIGCINLMDYTT